MKRKWVKLLLFSALSIVPGAILSDAHAGLSSGFRISTTGITSAYYAIHMEPGSMPSDGAGNPNTVQPEKYFEDLIEIVELADLYHFKLTLMFNGQYAFYINSASCQLPKSSSGRPRKTYKYQGMSYFSCLTLVRAFERQGHEIALHHHPLSAPAGWDGYTDETEWVRDGTTYGTTSPSTRDPLYLGTLNDLMDLVGKLSAGGADKIVSATTEEFPNQIKYRAFSTPESYTSRASPGDLVSAPCAREEDDHWTWQLKILLYKEPATSSVQSQVTQAISDYSTSRSPKVMGFISHTNNVHDDGIPPYQALFDRLKSNGIQVETLSTVMGRYLYTSNDPSTSTRVCK